MKKAVVLIRDINKDEIFLKEMIYFIRTETVSDISQVDILKSFRKKFKKDMHKGEVLMHSVFA